MTKRPMGSQRTQAAPGCRGQISFPQRSTPDSQTRESLQPCIDSFSRDTEKWAGEVKADPDIGGPRLSASVAAASRAIEWARVPGLKEALDFTGAGNNPAIVKAFGRFGQALAEDRFAAGNGAAPDQRSIAERLHNNTPKQSGS